MSLLITGAAGQLGQEWVHCLTDRQTPFHALGSEALDITSPDCVNRVLSRHAPKIVINCAAYTDVDGAEREPDRAKRVNADGVRNLAGWCEANDARLVHFSTDYVFAGREEDYGRYPDGYPEDAPADPMNRYGESKRAGEEMLFESGASYLLIRVSWLCGRYGDHFVRTMLRLAREKRLLRVVNDQIGSPTWGWEIPPLTLQLLNRGEEGIFHFTSGGKTTWYELARETFRLAGMDPALTPVSTREYPTPARRPAYSKLNTGKLCRTLNVKIKEWKEGLEPLVHQINKEME